MERESQSNDIELYEGRDGVVFLTEGGGLGIEIGGRVVVRSLSQWMDAVAPSLPFDESQLR